jgi:hypothetical protein
MQRKMLLQEEFLYVLCPPMWKEIKQKATAKEKILLYGYVKENGIKTHRKAYNLKNAHIVEKS